MSYNFHTTKQLSNWLVLYHYNDPFLDCYFTSDFKITHFIIDPEAFDLLDGISLSEKIESFMNYMFYVLKRDNDMLWDFKFNNVNAV